jgi:hypothetical protein
MGITRRQTLCVLGLGAACAAAAFAVPPVRRRLFHPIIVRMRGPSTVEQRVGELADARERLRQQFKGEGVSFPPARIVLVGLKEERRLEVYAGPTDDALRHVCDYPVLAASGMLGPKLREGDRQVPEGIYALESLNPNSRFHVALRVGYPNDFDRAMALRDGRSKLGGDIMIHGGSASIGCLAMGDVAAEDLFVLAAAAGVQNVTVILAPMDLRRRPLPPLPDNGWRTELYASLKDSLERLPG